MKISSNVLLRDKNWFQTGGYARFYCEPSCKEDFLKAFSFSKKNHLNIEVLGKGANILISDEGFDGLIIRPMLDYIEKTENFVKAGSGACIQKLIEFSLDNNLLGLEEFSGIPGSVGGSVYINIHYFNYFLSNFLKSATVINFAEEKVSNVDKDWFQFGYDTSKLQEKEFFLIDATFELKPATENEACYAKGRRYEMIRQRNSRYPISHTCGSFFRNLYDHELADVIGAKKLPFAAYYLDKLGIKGELSYGGASVSHKHANMIVNNGDATSGDIVNLAKEMQALVFKSFGVILQPECQLLGFKKYPFHKNIISSKKASLSLHLEKEGKI